MDMASEHNVRCVLLNPLHQVGVTEVFLSAPARWRFVWRCVIDPDPAVLGFHCITCELHADLLSGLWAVPPGADRKQRAGGRNPVLVGRHSEMAGLRNPLRELFPTSVPG